MRLCHMVKYNKKTLLSLTQSTDNNMKSFRSLPLPSVSRPLSCATEFWANQRRSEAPINSLVWGRIKNTGINYIVEGYQQDASEESLVKWVQVPCRTLLDARLFLGSVMDKELFDSVVDLERYNMANK